METTGETMSVLLVDDEDGFRGLAEEFFENEIERIEISTLGSAEEALDVLENENYDAIVSDYKMPDMDGLAFLEELRSRGDGTPFILLTGKGDEEAAMKALNAGADRYHKKSSDLEFGFHELTGSIIEEVVRKKSEQELRTFQSWIKNNFKSTSD